MTRKQPHRDRSSVSRHGGPDTPSSPPALQAAFRLSVVYLGLFCLATQISGSMLPNPYIYYRGLGP
jgi:hypothetical protein